MMPKRVFLLLHFIGAVLVAGIVFVSFFFIFFSNQELDKVQRCVLEYPLNCMNGTVSADSQGNAEISLTIQNLDRRAISIENIAASSKKVDTSCTSKNISKSSPLKINKKESKKILIRGCRFSENGISKNKFNVKIRAYYNPDFPKKLSGYFIALTGKNG